METPPLVSIVIALYNGEKYIGDAIESVLHQTYTGWELVIVDDGSTDNSHARIKMYLNDPRISYYKKENSGQAGARNLGIAKASGEYIALLDQDDTWIPEKLSLQMPFFTEGIDLVFSDAWVIGPDSQKTGQYLNPGSGHRSGAKGFNQFIHGNFFLPLLTVVCRKEVIKNANGFNENNRIRNADDFDLWARMLLNGARFFGMQQCTACYRVHAGQASAKDPANTLQVVESLLSIKLLHLKHKHTINRAIISRLHLLKMSGVIDPDDVHEMLKRLFPRFGKLHVLFFGIVGAKNYDRCSARLYPLICP